MDGEDRVARYKLVHEHKFVGTSLSEPHTNQYYEKTAVFVIDKLWLPRIYRSYTTLSSRA